MTVVYFRFIPNECQCKIKGNLSARINIYFITQLEPVVGYSLSSGNRIHNPGNLNQQFGAKLSATASVAQLVNAGWILKCMNPAQLIKL